MTIRTWLASGLILGGLVSGSPAEHTILAQVEIRGLDRVAADVARLTETVGQPMPGEALLGMAGGALGSPELAGLNPSGVFRLVVMESEGFPEEPPTMALIAPVTGDGQAYLDAVGQGMKADGEENGVRRFVRDEDAPPSMGPPEMQISLIDGAAVIGMEADAVRHVAGMAAGLASSSETELPGTVAIQIDVASLLSILEPMMEEKMGQMKEMLAAAEEAEDDSTTPPAMQDMDVGEVLDAEMDLVLGLLKQLDRIGLGLGLAGDALQIHTTLDTKAGSKFASALATARPPIAAIQTAFPANALYAQSMFIPGLDMMIGPYIDFMVDLYAGMGPEVSRMITPMLEQMKKIEGLYPGDYAMGVVPGENGEWPALVQLAAVTDKEKMMSVINEMIAAQEEMVDTGALGYTYSITSEVSRTHRDVEITTYDMQMEFEDDMADTLPPGFGEFFNNMRYDLVFVGDIAVYTFGRSNAMEQAIDRLLDGTGVAVTQGAAFRSRFPVLSPPPLDAYTIHAFDIARAVMALLPTELVESAPPIPQGPGAIAGYSVVRGAGMLSTMAIGLSDIAAVSELVQSAMTQPGGAMGGGPGSCPQNLKQLAIICYMQEAEAGAWPASWDEVGAQLGAPSPYGPPALLVCPLATDPSVPSYRIVATGSMSELDSPQTTVLIEEVEAHHNGKRHVAYGDGHVELVD